MESVWNPTHLLLHVLCMLTGLHCLLEKNYILNLDEGMAKEMSVSVRPDDYGTDKTINSSLSQCVKLGDNEPLALQMEGDVVIGGFFPLHYLVSELQHNYKSRPKMTSCSGFDHRAFRWMMTMIFAVEEINNKSDLLPGVKLGYHIMDSCDSVHTSLQSVFSSVSFSKSVTEEVSRPKENDNAIKTMMENKTSAARNKVDKDHIPRSSDKENPGINMKDESTAEDPTITVSESSLCLSGHPIPAVIGLASSSPTRALAQILGPLNIPLVSYFATCTCLSDKKKYPSFLRTVPSDVFQVRGLVKLVTYLGWFWLGTIGTMDDYSAYGIQAFSSQFKQQGGCVAFHLSIPKSPTVDEIQKLANTLQRSSAKVVVVFATEGQLLNFFLELAQRNVTGIQWVASEAWVTANLLTKPHFHNLLEGTLGFSFPGVSIPGLKEFLFKVRPSPKSGMEFYNMFWEEQFGCKLNFNGTVANENEDSKWEPQKVSSENVNGEVIPICTGWEDLSLAVSSYTDVSQVRISYNVYKAVFAIAHALHTLLNCDSMDPNMQVCNKYTHFASGSLLYHLKTVNFTNRLKERVYFDSSGEPIPLYDIVNWQKSRSEIRFIKVGVFDGSAPPGQQLQINGSSIIWTRGQSKVPVSQCSPPCPPGSRQAKREREPHCCFDCLSCPDGEISNQTGSTECLKCPEFSWPDTDKVKCLSGVEEFLSFTETMGIILVTLTLLGVFLTMAITVIFHRFRTSPIVKANNSEISFLLLLSLKLCFLCSLVFIGQPSAWTCLVRQAAFGISFVICLSCLLVKTVVVLLAFRVTLPSSTGLKIFGPTQQKMLIFCTTAPQICLCAGWLVAAPPVPFRNPTYQFLSGKIVVECREPWPVGFYLLLSYIGLLAFLCLSLAFVGRKLPDTFNEAKLITFSMVIFWAVWISFIPAYLSSPGKFSVVVEIFAILASSFGLLLCIFLPKCYIILLHPEKNQKRLMSGSYNR